ncbi:unnamed protein product, partial [Cyprideis torosa]
WPYYLRDSLTPEDFKNSNGGVSLRQLWFKDGINTVDSANCNNPALDVVEKPVEVLIQTWQRFGVDPYHQFSYMTYETHCGYRFAPAPTSSYVNSLVCLGTFGWMSTKYDEVPILASDYSTNATATPAWCLELISPTPAPLSFHDAVKQCPQDSGILSINSTDELNYVIQAVHKSSIFQHETFYLAMNVLYTRDIDKWNFNTALFHNSPVDGEYCSILDVGTSQIRPVSCDESHPPICRRGAGDCDIPDTIKLFKANIGPLNVDTWYGASNAKNCTCQMRMENSGSYGVSYGCYGRAGVVPSQNFHDNCNTTNRVFNGEECFILMTSPLPLDEAAQMCYAEFASPISEVKSRSALDALLNAMSIGGYDFIRVANNILNDPAALSFNFAEISSFNGSISQWRFYDNSIVKDNLQISSKKPSHSPSTPKPGLAIYYDEVLNMTGLTTVDPREPYPYLCSASKTQ